MRKFLAGLLLVAGPLWGAGGTQYQLNVNTGTVAAVDTYTNADGAVRQAIVLGDFSSSDTLRINNVVGIPVYLSTQTTVVAVPVISTNTLTVQPVGITTVTFNGTGQPVTQSGTWTVQPGNTPNTTAWKVDGSAVTQPVSGTFWQATQPISGSVSINNPSLGVYTVSNSTNPLLIQSTSAIPSSQSGTWGININNPGSGVYTVQNSTNPMLVQSTSTLKAGGVAYTALPTAAGNAVITDKMLDKFGRTVTIADCPRDLILSTGAVLTTTTAEYVLLSSGAAGVFNDAVAIVVTNSSATGSLLTFRTNGNGTTSTLHFYVPPTDTRGFTLPHIWLQGTAAANWTVTSSASVSSIYVDMTYCQNK